MSVPDPSISRLADPVRAAIVANKSLFLVVFVFSAVLSVLSLTVSFYMLEVYDRVLASRSEETLLLLTVIAVAGLAVFGVLDALRQRLLMRASMRVADRLSARVLRAMVAVSAVAGTPSRQGQAGMSARVNLTAYKQRRLPIITGTVVSVSADRLVDQHTGQAYFNADIAVDRALLRGYPDARLIPGIPVEIAVETGTRAMMGYLWEPIQLVLRRGLREK